MQYYNSNLKKKIAFVDSSGPWLIDKHGNKFWDSWLGSGTLIFGHKKIKNSNTCNMLPTNNIFDFAEPDLINNLVSFEIGSIGLQTSGSSAITRACRVARAITNKRLIALIGDFWHGSEDDFLFRHNFEFLSDGLTITPNKNFLWFKTIESFLSKKDKQEFAAILVEPNQGSNPKVNMLKELSNKNVRQKIRDENILVILDEIITGFREAYGSSELARKCNPDIVVFGKAIGGGYPIGVVIVNKYCTDLGKSKNIFWGGTFSANPTQIRLMSDQLKSLKNLDFKILKINLNHLCTFLSQKINLESLGYKISKGHGFARIIKQNENKVSSRGFLFNQNDSEKILEKECFKNNIFLAKNRLIFPSIYNIIDNLKNKKRLNI
tara:strand:- start:6187 stop:7323 length:1137 start_codon:yes stop_codon:yes gene_type:complete